MVAEGMAHRLLYSGALLFYKKALLGASLKAMALNNNKRTN
jgi:hypothetical protein